MKLKLALIITCFSLHIMASPRPDFPFVTVTGEGMQEVKPDKVEVALSITAFDNSSEQAERLFSLATSNVLDILTRYDMYLLKINPKMI